jgi:hypothetical protein
VTHASARRSCARLRQYIEPPHSLSSAGTRRGVRTGQDLRARADADCGAARIASTAHRPARVGSWTALVLSPTPRKCKRRCSRSMEPNPVNHRHRALARFDGFNLHAGTAFESHERVAVERLCRFALRGPLVLRRLSQTTSGSLGYRLKNLRPDGARGSARPADSGCQPLIPLSEAIRAASTRRRGESARQCARRATGEAHHLPHACVGSGGVRPVVPAGLQLSRTAGSRWAASLIGKRHTSPARRASAGWRGSVLRRWSVRRCSRS